MYFKCLLVISQFSEIDIKIYRNYIMDTYIKEWVNIQNIVVEKTFNKFMLDSLSINEHDVCELINVESCDLAESCTFYKNKCVNKNRLHSMHKTNVILHSKNGNIPFRVIDSMFLSKVQLTTTSIDMYYCMVESIYTKTVYVLFSSGIVLRENELQKNHELNDRLMILIGKLIGLVKKHPTTKFVLGGHSMGNVLASYTGWLMYSNPKYKHYFENNGYIIGTAGAKWLGNPELFRDLPNIKIFISGELRIAKTKKLLIDCFMREGDDNKHAYEPLTVIYKNTDDGEIHFSEFAELDPTFQIVYPEKSTSQCKKLHMFSYYQHLINHIYDAVEIEAIVRDTPKTPKTAKSRSRSRKTIRNIKTASSATESKTK